MLTVGTPAPEFSAKDQYGNLVELSSLKGNWILLYFYPKDDTPGCTKEACDLRDAWAELSRLATVIGISADDEVSHKEFADKYNLPFQLLADTDKTILKAYHAWGEKEIIGKKYEGILRTSYLINPEGEIAQVYPDVNPEEHKDQVMADLKKFQQSA